MAFTDHEHNGDGIFVNELKAPVVAQQRGEGNLHRHNACFSFRQRSRAPLKGDVKRQCYDAQWKNLSFWLKKANFKLALNSETI